MLPTGTITCTSAALRPQLTFATFSTEANFDYLSLSSMDSSGVSPTTRLHGSEIPSPYTASRHVLVAHYTSDGSINAMGFTASFSCLDPSTVPPPPPTLATARASPSRIRAL